MLINMGSFSSKGRIRVVQVKEATLEIQGTRISPKAKHPRVDSKVKRSPGGKTPESTGQDKENIKPNSGSMDSPISVQKLPSKDKPRPLTEGNAGQ